MVFTPALTYNGAKSTPAELQYTTSSISKLNNSRLASTNLDADEVTEPEDDPSTQLQDYVKLFDENKEVVSQTLQNLKSGTDLTRVLGILTIEK